MSRTRSDFKTVKSLGEAAANGGCNKGIYLVKCRSSGKKYIEKRVGRKAIERGYFQREVAAMLQWQDHPNIVCIVGHDFKDASRLGYSSIFMQRCELGDVDGIIDRYSGRRERLADEGFLWKVFWDISLALASLWTGHGATYIRERAVAGKTTTEKPDAEYTKILHRDLKPANFFLIEASLDGRPMHYPRVVLGDFGASATMDDIRSGRVSPDNKSIFTPSYNAPEFPRYFARSDTYQLAMSIQCIARMNNTPDLERFPPWDPLPSAFKDSGLRALLEECLQEDFQNRPFPGDLPMKVIKGYSKWMGKYGNGKKLASWAFS
jgi:serine/threonine protein kinase